MPFTSKDALRRRASLGRGNSPRLGAVLLLGALPFVGALLLLGGVAACTNESDPQESPAPVVGGSASASASAGGSPAASSPGAATVPAAMPPLSAGAGGGAGQGAGAGGAAAGGAAAGGAGGTATVGAPGEPGAEPGSSAGGSGGAAVPGAGDGLPAGEPSSDGDANGAGGAAGGVPGAEPDDDEGTALGEGDAGVPADDDATVEPAAPDAGMAAPSRPARVLLYSFSTLDIPSVPAQLAILRQTLEGWQYEVEESVDPAAFTPDNLARFAAVGMINTCFSPFGEGRSGEAEAAALQGFLEQGGGLFGTHCASVTFQSANPPALYNQLIGGRASSQNFEGESVCRKLEEHPTTAALPDEFTYVGNLDGTDFIADDSTVLVSCAWNAGAGMEVAVSWVRNEGAGRVFFTNFAKVDADLTDATVGDPHILAGLGWVLGR